MTKQTHPDNKFLSVDTYKFEARGKLIDDFTEACTWFKVKRTDVLKFLMAEFVEDARYRILDKAYAEKKPDAD